MSAVKLDGAEDGVPSGFLFVLGFFGDFPRLKWLDVR